jgi:uncharacterized membrane protein YdbT with pleckstrin-like domain
MEHFPASILGPDEDLVFDLRPHWIALVKPAAQTLSIVVALVVVFLVVPYSWGAWIYVVAVLIALAAFVLAPGQAFTRWATSHFVLTTDRIMRRRGWIAKESIEIPLDKISDVRFRQSVLERMLGAGDVVIESAGRSGQERLQAARKPEWIQRTIYEIKERLMTRRSLTEVPGGGPLWGPASVADELTKLHQLVTQGVLTVEEFQSAKARLLRRV